jgi:TolA-binding protein
VTIPGTGGGRQENGLPPPLILVVVSLFVLMAFETGQAIRDRGALAELMRAQQPSIEQAAKLRQQLQNLAGKTAELAAAGDAGAKSVVDQMKAQGVTLGVPKK